MDIFLTGVTGEKRELLAKIYKLETAQECYGVRADAAQDSINISCSKRDELYKKFKVMEAEDDILLNKTNDMRGEADTIRSKGRDIISELESLEAKLEENDADPEISEAVDILEGELSILADKLVDLDRQIVDINSRRSDDIFVKLGILNTEIDNLDDKIKKMTIVRDENIAKLDNVTGRINKLHKRLDIYEKSI